MTLLTVRRCGLNPEYWGLPKISGQWFFMAHELLLKEIGHLIRPNSRPHFSVGLLPASGGLLSNDKKIEIEKSKQTHQT